jgi:hypothetical protein
MSSVASYPAFAAAADDFERLVARVRPHAWDGPGLGSWNLRALVGHTSRSLTTVLDYVDKPAADEVLPSPEAYYAAVVLSGPLAADPDAVAERGRAAGAALGDDPAAAISELAARVRTRIHDQGDVLIETIGGGMWLSQYLPTRTFELVVHSLDIATATGVDHRPVALALDSALQLAGRIAAEVGHGERVLLALTGRSPLPAGFSLV